MTSKDRPCTLLYSGREKSGVGANKSRPPRGSKDYTSAHLNNPRVVCIGRLPEISIVQVSVNALQVHPVQHVEEFKPQLKVYVVAEDFETVVLNETRVDVYESRVSVRGSFQIPFRSRGRRAKDRCWRDSLYVLAAAEARRQRRSGSIWKIKIHAVRIVIPAVRKIRLVDNRYRIA